VRVSLDVRRQAEMRSCPECSESLSVLFVIGLHPSAKKPPTPCPKCGLLLKSNLFSFLLPYVGFVAFLFAPGRTWPDGGARGLEELLVALGIWAFLAYSVTKPVPYTGYKAYCPRCMKRDAIHDWTEDPTCVACEKRLRPGPKDNAQGAA